MDYNKISNFLESFKKVFQKTSINYKIIVGVITKHISFPVTEKMISVKGAYILIKSSPALRNEVLIHKQGILKDLRDLIPEHQFIDIR